MRTTGKDRRRRRYHSAQFKADAVAACRHPGVSLASVALSRGLNANLLRRWVVQAERAETASGISALKALPAPIPMESFVPVSLRTAPGPGTAIQIEVRRGATVVTVQWPVAAARECAVLLRKLLR